MANCSKCGKLCLFYVIRTLRIKLSLCHVRNGKAEGLWSTGPAAHVFCNDDSNVGQILVSVTSINSWKHDYNDMHVHVRYLQQSADAAVNLPIIYLLRPICKSLTATFLLCLNLVDRMH